MAKAPAATPNDKIVTLGRKLFAVKAEKDRIEDELAAVNETIKRLATVELAKIMEDAGVEKTTLAGLGTIYLSQVFYASVPADAKPQLYEWLRANGSGDLVQDYVHPGTLKAFAKEMMEKNISLPEFFKVFYQPTAQTRKS